jgi:hypothetical protein
MPTLPINALYLELQRI